MEATPGIITPEITMALNGMAAGLERIAAAEERLLECRQRLEVPLGAALGALTDGKGADLDTVAVLREAAVSAILAADALKSASAAPARLAADALAALLGLIPPPRQRERPALRAVR